MAQTAARRKLIALLLGLLVGLSFAQQDNADATLLQGLAGNEDFSSLVRLLDQAGLIADLEGTGPFTVFAPSNGVLRELNPDVLRQLNDDPELLKSVLRSHIVQGAYGIKELSDAEAGSVVTLNGEPLEIDLTAGGLTVDGADLVSTDVDNTYSNGVLNEVGDLVLSASLRSQLDISDTEEATSDVATGGLALTFADLDTDANGVLSQDELDAGLYTGYDADRDGIIDQTEYDANPGLFGGAFADFDTNASGGLNEEEYRGAFADGNLFNQLDADGSGDVSQTEFDANRDSLGSGAMSAAVPVMETGGAETGGAIEAETGGAETGGAETGGADMGTETGGATGAETGGTMTGTETGGAETGGAETDGAETGGAETGGAPASTEENADTLFDQLDADGSGDISREEFDANRDLLGLGAVGTTGAAVGGAEVRGSEGGAETGGAAAGTETGGALSPAQTATPTAAQQTLPDTAQVRVIHLSPNAPVVDISLTSTLEGGETLTPEALTGLSYEASTDYLDVPVGDYTVSVTSEGTPVLEEEMNFAPGISYTLAAIGLVLPNEDAEAEEEGGGFVGFIQDLFSGGSEPDTLSLKLLRLEDTLLAPMVEGDTLIRLVHAAPGTDAVDLTVTNPEDAVERQNVIDNVAFGEASGYTSLAEGFSEPAVTIAGSEAVAFDLAETAFERGTVNTLFVTGTALEQAPLKVIAFSDAPQLDPTAALAAPATGLGATDPSQQTVGDVVLVDPNLATLALALDQVGLLEVLRGPGPFTLFAPSDDAFAALPQEQLDALLANPEALMQVLNNHVVQGVAPSAALSGAGSVTTVDGTNLAVTAAADGTLSVENAVVVGSDIQANNGVIHVIDTVLLPEGLELTP